MVGLFYIYLPMSFSIPHQIEQDIIDGKAVYRTFQTGNGGQSILQVPTNSYAVIYGYDFSPAGGGFNVISGQMSNTTNVTQGHTSVIAPFETQQISFFTGNDFFPFIHHVNIDVQPYVDSFSGALIDDQRTTLIRNICTVDNTPLSRQVYITSTNDIAITVGLIRNTPAISSGSLPITSRTPAFLTYGGSAQVIQNQTNYGPNGAPQNFMQPSIKDYQDFAFGLLPNNPTDQAFATPDLTNGLLEPTQYIFSNIGANFLNFAGLNYFLCIHYALYNKTIPETRG
jgi:hypothetical protein